MTATNVAAALMNECRRCYLLDAMTDLQAAERYLSAVTSVDGMLAYLDGNPRAFADGFDHNEFQRLKDALDAITANPELGD
jgi:hypothetical protein